MSFISKYVDDDDDGDYCFSRRHYLEACVAGLSFLNSRFLELRINQRVRACARGQAGGPHGVSELWAHVGRQKMPIGRKMKGSLVEVQ